MCPFLEGSLMGWTSRIGRPCRYVTGWPDKPAQCGTKTQNLIDDPNEGRIPICAYHSQFSKPPADWPRD
jgi:hypothetical protein